MEERRKDRHPVRRDVRVLGRRGPSFNASVSDFSATGCQLYVEDGFEVGEFVIIEIGDVAAIKGWIAWSRPGRAGVDFAEALAENIVTAVREPA